MNREKIALSALDAYPIAASRTTFLRHNENMVFQVFDEQASAAYLLRVHAPLTTTFQGERLRPEGIASELYWLEALVDDTGLVLQRPVHTKDGALVSTVMGDWGDIACSLLHWIEADPFPAVPSADQVARLGTMIAILHAHARKWPIPASLVRPVYDLAFHRQQVNKLDMGVRTDIIREEDFAIIQETLELIFAMLREAQEPLILIHADLHRGNLLVSENDVHPIDFSLCGFGFPLFDLGTCLPGIPTDLRPVLLHAYQQQERLPSAYPRLIDAYFMLSRMGAHVYLLPNPLEHEWLRERIPRFAAQECRMFLEGRPLLFGGGF